MRRWSVSAAVAGAAALMALVLGGAPAGARATLSLDPLPGTYNQPTYVAQAPRTPRLLFVVEQPGKIAVLRDGHPLAKPFLNIRNRVTYGGEQGLLSMAFDPKYRSNGRFYVYFTNRNCKQSSGACNIEVDGFRRSPHSQVRARVSSRTKVIEVVHRNQQSNHNGGQLQFGPDGHLYMAPGDGGTQGDPENDAQRRNSLLGKILRIDPEPGGGYTVPADNPFVGAQGKDEIFSMGLRNPFRFSFDSQTGDLWIGDVGWSQREEIDRATIAQANGGNFGWHIFEGRFPCGDCGFGPGTDPPPHYIAPVHDYPHSGPGEHGNVIIGGYVVHDPDLPSVDGKYIYTDDGAGDLRTFNPQNSSEQSLGLDVSAPSSFGQGLDGSIYVASLGDNKVYELVQGAKTAAKARAHRRVGDGRGGVRLAKLGNFDSPDYVASAPGATHVTYVVQLGGKVIAVGHGHRRTFLNISHRTTNEGERGLLSIAFDPHYRRNSLFYTYSTNRQGNIEIDEFHAKSNMNARERSRRKVIEIPHPGQDNHNGGTVQFGPDGKLYFATGDGGAGGDPPENAQNKHRLLGKLIRIDPHKFHGKPYRVPRSNPFFGRSGRDEIYALGLRNPFRFSFDRRTKHILIGDVGQDSWEEVDYESKHSLRGANFGWDHFEGFHRFDYPNDNEAPRPKHHYEPPILNYSHSHGCAIIGGYLIRDPKLRSLRGRYVYTDLCAGDLRSLVPHKKHASGDRSAGLSVPNPNGWGLAHGHVYIASGNGPVYRLAPEQ
jgi:glucose/arabinose dehydrogenase